MPCFVAVEALEMSAVAYARYSVFAWAVVVMVF